jgi:response regulator RpfG family c-di-GMP phosphodiesterase
MKPGPIIIIEDDADDKHILEMILKDLGVDNQLIWFTNCKDAFVYLKTTAEQPFIIFSDMNLPEQSGIDFKKQIDEHPQLHKKCIPFIFYSTSVDQATVNQAYTEMTVQGFFEKKTSLEGIRKTIRVIIDYWEECRHPNC